MSTPNPEAVAAGHIMYRAKLKKHGAKKLAQMASAAGKSRGVKLSDRRLREIARMGGIAKAAKMSKRKQATNVDSFKS